AACHGALGATHPRHGRRARLAEVTRTDLHAVAQQAVVAVRPVQALHAEPADRLAVRTPRIACAIRVRLAAAHPVADAGVVARTVRVEARPELVAGIRRRTLAQAPHTLPAKTFFSGLTKM